MLISSYFGSLGSLSETANAAKSVYDLFLAMGAIAAIVSILLCFLSLGNKAMLRNNILGHLFNGDHRHIESLVKAIYIFNVVGITCLSLHMVVSAIIVDTGIKVLFDVFVVAVIVFVVGQVFARLMFELLMTWMSLVSDTRAIREHLVGIPTVHSNDPSAQGHEQGAFGAGGGFYSNCGLHR